MWRILRHPNVLPLLGVTITESPRRFVVVSEWMEDRDITQFLQHEDADRLKLVCIFRGFLFSLNIDNYVATVARRRYQRVDPYA